jgi:hypothetical protein
LIHLLMRPRARPVSIGSLRFLKLALKETRRRRKIRRWLLLATRMAAVLLLTLLFARPYLTSFGGLGQNGEVVVLVDQSGSMASVYSGETLFARAQMAAKRIIAGLPEGTKIHLAYFDSRGVAVSPSLLVDSNRQPGYAGTDFGQALSWARDIFVTSDRSDRKVFLLTDLQRTGRRVPCKNFPGDVKVEIYEIGKPLLGNLAIESAEVRQATIRSQEPIVVSARVSNAGVLPSHNVHVRLWFETNGIKSSVQTKTIAIAPGASEQVDFSVVIERPGLYQGVVEVDADDGFPVDNRRWFAFDARDADRILLVDGDPGSSLFANETYYLEMALRLAVPGVKEAARTPYVPERVAIAEDAYLPDLGSYSVVVLCNVATISGDNLNRLRTFVDWGGRLLIFTGRKVAPEGYAALAQSGMLPCTIEGTSKAGVFSVQAWDKSHPIFRPLSDPQQGDLRRVAFRRITRVKPAPEAKVLASALGGSPLLLEKTIGRGTVLMFTSAVDRDWGDWPQSRLFVPMVHQIVGYLTARLPENQRIHTETAGPEAEKPPGITTDKNIVNVRNVDSSESRLQRYTEKQFRDEFRLADVKVAEAPRQAQAAFVPIGAERPNELWTSVVWALLLILAIELFIANRTHA